MFTESLGEVSPISHLVKENLPKKKGTVTQKERLEEKKKKGVKKVTQIKYKKS